MPKIKAGPLVFDDLLNYWQGAVDKAYREPFLSAGDGKGFEAWTQAFVQLARASKAIDVTTQAMYISPWSGQTGLPASGATRSRVTLTFSRTGRFYDTLVLGAGTVFAEEQTTDEGESAPVDVLTGRRYVLLRDLAFGPGEAGPYTVLAEAEKDGYGYDNPLPGTIKAVVQVGPGFNNDHASLTTVSQPAVLNGAAETTNIASVNEPDMFVPGQLGQYVTITSGVNAGKSARMSVFRAPVPPFVGSSMDLVLDWSVDMTTFAGTFAANEVVAFDNGGSPVAYGRVVGERVAAGVKRLTFVFLNGGSLGVGSNATGVLSGATGTVRTVLSSSQFVDDVPVAEIGGASWRVLDWVEDWGLTCTNVLSPTGGRAAFLDEIGDERGINRAPGEDDDSYRSRVREIADVVTPNAVRRALNRSIPGVNWCLREVGTASFRGFFFDGDNAPSSITPGRDRDDAYDYDSFVFVGTLASGTFLADESVLLEESGTFLAHATGYFGTIQSLPSSSSGVLVMVRRAGQIPDPPTGLQVRGLTSGAVWTVTAVIENQVAEARRFRVYLQIEDFRAYFLVGVPVLPDGEFGLAWDAGPFDSAPFLSFYDGFPTTAAITYSKAYAAVDTIRAGGVGFNLYLEDGGCVADMPTGQPVFLLDPDGMTGIEGRFESFAGVTVDGSNRVTNWVDQSGHSFDFAQATSGNRPTRLAAGTGSARNPAISFDGSKWLTATRKAFATGWTLVVVAKPTATSAGPSGSNPGYTVVGDSNAGFKGQFGISSTKVDYEDTGSHLGTNAIATFDNPNGLAFFAVAHDAAGGTVEFYGQGLPDGSTALAWAASGIDRIGVGHGDANGFQGELYEVLVFSRRLTPKEVLLLFYRAQWLYY